uniref:Cell surface protein n=1 Tax=Melittangium lichenicola TaxID=45 RepID=A0A3Q8I4L2_9BACT|nr:cell surface protein [Melittangium lichenicola]
MWRKVLGLLWVSALCACTQPLNRCDENSLCPAGTVCQENVCVGTGETDSAACDGGCADYQVCLANTLQCSPRFLDLVVTPADQTVVDGGELVVRAELRLAGNYEARFPETLSLSVEPSSGGAPTQLARTGEGVYGAPWTPAAEGPYRLTVSYPETGGPSTRVGLTVDRTGPVLTVSLPVRSDGGTADGGFVYADPSLPGAWRRDQTVALRVESSAADVDPQSLRVRVSLSGSDGGVSLDDLAVTQAASCGAGIGYCGTVDVPLWKPGLPAFRGEFAVEVNAKDRVGNASSGNAKIPVTRWKWRYDIAAATITAAPAVGNMGTIYVGTTVSGNTDGRLLAIADDGRVLWDANTGAVVASPSVGNVLSAGSERVYAAHKKGNTSRVGFYVGTNSFNATCPDLLLPSALVQSALAIGQVATNGGSTLETVYGVYTGRSGGTVFAVRPDAAEDPQLRCPTNLSVGEVLAPGSMLASGNSAIFGTSSGRLKSYTLAANGLWNNSAQWDRSLSLATPTSLAVADGGIFVGSNDGSASRVFAAALDGGQEPTSVSTSSPAWNISFGGSPTVRGVVGLNNSKLLLLNSADGGIENINTPSDVIKGAPVWGTGGHVYTASSTTGVIEARRPLETVEWQFDTESSIEASMNLDCSRSSDGGVRSGVPGVLYATSQDGKIFALIVDSPGLDPSAPWPKYQHDSRNTGNPETPITSCP